MDHKERFFATIERRPVDRPATWMGIPDTSAFDRLFDYFKVSCINELIVKLDDDVVPVEMPYHSPTAEHIYTALDFAKKGAVHNEERTLTAPGFFQDYSDPQKINDFDWPEPVQHISADACRQMVAQAPDGRILLGVVWSAHFQDACAAFGMETALMKMYDAPEMFQAVIDRILKFYMDANEAFYAATEGKLDAVLIGNDFGAQTSLLLSPRQIRQFVFEGTKQLIDQARHHGLKVIHHSCGAIRPIIPDLIELGADAIHPIQALAAGMEPEGLKQDFGDRVSFCGGVDAQNLMVNGTPEEVREAVFALRRLFPTGLIISPSHEAILPDTPPENLEAMFEAARAPLA